MVLSMEQLMVLLAGQLGLLARQGPAAGCKMACRALLAGLLKLVARQRAPARLRLLLLLKLALVGLPGLALRQAGPASLLLAGLPRLAPRQTAPAQLLQLLHSVCMAPLTTSLAAWQVLCQHRPTDSASSLWPELLLPAWRQQRAAQLAPSQGQQALGSTQGLWSVQRQQGLKGKTGSRKGQTLQ